MIRVVVVDDHAVVRSGLCLLLDAEQEIEVVGEAGVSEAVVETRAREPDVILLDLVLPGESGIEGMPKLLAVAPEAKVLVLSIQNDPQYVREAFAAGGTGYVLKEAVDAEVVQAVRAVAGGGRYLHPALGARLLAAEAAYQNREFRELAGASFVLGASARIVEAADAPGRSVPPRGWLAALRRIGDDLRRVGGAQRS